MANTNNRYKIRLSEQPIFWSTNSIDHPTRELWESTYLPTFFDLDTTPINFIDMFTLSMVCDKDSYTMLELTDTKTGKVMYYLNNNINKQFDGFEMIYKLDIYLSFCMDFYDWLKTNKLPINVKRFLNNDLLKEWYKQFKFIQQDELLNYSAGTQKITMTQVQNNNNNYQFNVYNMDDWLKDGTQTSITTINDSVNWNNTYKITQTDWNQMLFYVFEQNDGNYWCIAKYGTKTVKTTQTGVEPYLVINDTPTTTIQVLVGNSVNNIVNNDYWINRFVGIFLVPPFFLIDKWFILKGSTNYLGFSIARSGFIQLQSLNNSISWNFGDSDFKVMNNSIFDTSTQNYIIDNDYNFKCNILFFNPNDNDLLDNNKYFVNAYFLSQVRKTNSVIQLPPIDGYWNMFENAILTFDGTNFNVVNNFQNVKSFIETYPGTINVSIDSYKEWLSSAQPVMNAQLQTTKASLDIEQNQNIFNGVMDSIGGFFGMMGSIGDGNVMGGISSLLGIGSTIGNSVYNSQKLNQDYKNLQIQQDAEKSARKIGSGASNISSSFTLDDSYVKLLLTNQNETHNEYIFGKSYVVDFVSNINDLKFIHNLIWKNGIKAEIFITADIAFNDNTMNTIGNKFLYLNFEFDENYIRMYSQNMPVAYVEALKVVCSNSIRLWNSVYDLANMPSYYIDFHNQARLAFQELNKINITYTFNNDDNFGVYINPNNITLDDNQLKATDYANNVNIDIIKQLFFSAITPNDVDESDFTFQVLSSDYVATLNSNLQSAINEFFNGKNYDPTDSNGQIYYLITTTQNKYFSAKDYNNLKYLANTNQNNGLNYYIIEYNAPFKQTNLSNLTYNQVQDTTFKWLKTTGDNEYYNDLNNTYTINLDSNPQSITLQSNKYIGLINDITSTNSANFIELRNTFYQSVSKVYPQITGINNLTITDNNDGSYTYNFSWEVSL